MDNVVEHNIFCFTINLVFMIIWIRQIILIGLSGTLPLFFSVLYLNFKFKEIFEGLKKSIETKNRRMMYCSVIKHSKASDLTRNLNEFIINIIGMAYGFGSANMVITFIWPVPQLWDQNHMVFRFIPFNSDRLFGKSDGGVGNDGQQIRCQTFVSDFHWESIP